MLISINDMHRLHRLIVGPYRHERWQLEEWGVHPNRSCGVWRPYTRRMPAKDMERLLVHMKCPAVALANFREVADGLAA